VNSELLKLYQAQILEHHRNPLFQGKGTHCPIQLDARNPLCGDELKLYLEIDSGHFHQLWFTAEGCALSRASASMMTGYLQSKPIDESQHIIESLIENLKSPTPQELPEPLQPLASVRAFPARMKCALMVWETLQHFLKTQSQPSF
jgi:nitrogen fixation NifU-like protein